MNKIIATFIKTFLFSTLVFVPAAALAQSPPPPPPSQIESGANAARPDGVSGSLTVSFKKIANVLIFLVGAVAVLVLILGGLTYVLSSGDAARVKRAKDTILYGVVGVVVAILAYAIINFVIGAIG